MELSPPFEENAMKDARDACLKWHNIFRAWHNGSGNVPMVELDEDVRFYSLLHAPKLTWLMISYFSTTS